MGNENLLATLTETELGIPAIAGRMLMAAFLGLVIGIDREYLNRPAGLRTHTLVALAAATFAIITFELMARFSHEGEITSDPIRVIEAVTAGVAFLAAGTIIQARGQVHGLTTGAGLWLAGAIGTACGIGAYAIAILATVLGFIVLSLLRLVEGRMPKSDAGRKPQGDSGDEKSSA
jgi:putative Mg2+ transporter-C (MgtC) family protein